MKMSFFSNCAVFALAFCFISGAHGLFCYKSTAFSRRKIVDCKDGSCRIIGFKGMQSAGCSPKHKTGSYVVGEYTYFYCLENLCNKYWAIDEYLGVEAIADESLQDKVPNAEVLLAEDFGEQSTNKGYSNTEALDDDFLENGILDIKFLASDRNEDEHHINDFFDTEEGHDEVLDSPHQDDKDSTADILETLFDMNGYRRVRNEIFDNLGSNKL